ncbi:MAG: dehydrogenase [Actinomycetia bacterium]|nr:dehydrogenase [Actinomycetes bacterium]
MTLDTAIAADLHRRMLRIRLFEEAAGRLFEANRIPGFIHLYVGQEAVAAGVCAALRDNDQISSTHRGHGHLVAKGGELDRMMAELMGKATGYCRGKGGSMHICDLDLDMLGANGIVGGGVPIAVGAGFANTYRGNDTVSVAFFGDGTTNIGAFHEAANMAAALKLPVLFVCENNEYAEYTPRSRTMAIDDVVERAPAYGMPGAVVDGMDAVAVYEATAEALETIRAGGGPVFLEAKTYRYYNHHGIQTLGMKYRSDDEVEQWRGRDAIVALETRMVEGALATVEEVEAARAEVAADVDAAIEFAQASPDPDPADLLDNVYTETRRPAEAPEPPGDPTRQITYLQAFNEAMNQLMEANPEVFVAGEDVGRTGGVFHNFDGLVDTFGERRMVDTPIAEQAIIGMGIGAAVVGLRPVVDLMFMDFVLVAMDQIANQAAKLKYMFGGNATLPMTITTMGGAGLSAGSQHSQSLEAMLAHVPGLKVVMPSTPADMKGLLAASILDDNPVLVMLHKRMLGTKGPVAEALYETPLGSAAVTRPGSDVTVVSWSRMAAESLAAAEQLAGEGIDCEVIDLRTVSPIDIDTVLDSARRTNRIVVVHEAVRTGGLGAEIAAQVQEHAFDYLDAPVARVGAPFAPVPFSPALESVYVPDAQRVATEIRATLNRPAPGQSRGAAG